MKTILAILLATAFTAFAEVPKGVDKKWDNTLTVRLVKTSPVEVSIHAIAPPGGKLTVVWGSHPKHRRTLEAGQTETWIVSTRREYKVTAIYNERVLDTEAWNRKSGLGKSSLDTGGGL